MEQNGKVQFRVIASYVSVLIVALLGIGLLLMDFELFGLFFISVLAAFLIWLIWQWLKPKVTAIKFSSRALVLFFVPVITVTLCLGSILFFWRGNAGNYIGPYIEEYTASIIFLEEDTFQIQESIVYNPGSSSDPFGAAELPGVTPPTGELGSNETTDPATLADEGDPSELDKLLMSGGAVAFDPRVVAGTRLGLLTKEVTIDPLESTPTGRFTRQLSDGSVLSGQFCARRCPETNVVLKDFPAGIFNEARYAADLQTSRYATTETILWRVIDPGEGITFSYIPPPFIGFDPYLHCFPGEAVGKHPGCLSSAAPLFS